MLIEKTERSRRLTESAFLRKLAGKLHRMEKGAVAPAAGSDAERRALAGFVRQLTAGDEAWVLHLGEDPQYIAGAGPDDDFALIADGVRDGALFQRLVGIALRDTELSAARSGARVQRAASDLDGAAETLRQLCAELGTLGESYRYARQPAPG